MRSKDTPIAADGRSIQQHFIMFFGISIVFFYFSFWGQLISAQSNDQVFADYFGHVQDVLEKLKEITGGSRELTDTELEAVAGAGAISDDVACD